MMSGTPALHFVDSKQHIDSFVCSFLRIRICMIRSQLEKDNEPSDSNIIKQEVFPVI
jgi:hypothetical protein